MELARVRSPLPPETEALVRLPIGCLLEVHRDLEPGLSELAYTAATCVELDAAGVRSRAPGADSVLLRLTGARVGLVVNFNVPVLREGIRRVVL